MKILNNYNPYRLISIAIGFILSAMAIFILSLRWGYNLGYVDGAEEAQRIRKAPF